jgi:hypothetical protein
MPRPSPPREEDRGANPYVAPVAELQAWGIGEGRAKSSRKAHARSESFVRFAGLVQLFLGACWSLGPAY